MGNKKALFAVGTTALTAFGTFVACGSDKAKPDAAVQHDAPIDTPKAIDAAVDSTPPADLTCFGSAQGSSAPATITIAGETQTFDMSGSAVPVPNVDVGAYKTGVPAALASMNSGSAAMFSLDVPTGTMPLDGYLTAAKSTYRTTYFFPPNPLTASISMVPVLMLSDTVFSLIASQLAHVTQDDTANGVVFATVVDCSNNPLTGATISVTQNGSAAGSATDLSNFGIPAVIVFNVPDGNVDVGATYNNMTFPPHTVVAHKQPNGSGAEGTLTFTAVRPGP